MASVRGAAETGSMEEEEGFEEEGAVDGQARRQGRGGWAIRLCLADRAVGGELYLQRQVLTSFESDSVHSRISFIFRNVIPYTRNQSHIFKFLD